MSKTIDDGGPAFPILVPGWSSEAPQHVNGMSLRDWFAGMAMEGAYANLYGEITEKGEPELARICYRQADAMIAERNKKHE